MQYRTVDDMYNRGTLVELTDRWTPALARYQLRPAVVIDVEVIGFPRAISIEENGTTITQKYDCIYTVALMPERRPQTISREQMQVIRIISLDIEREMAAHGELARFANWCAREFCGAEPVQVPRLASTTPGSVVAGAIMPHTIPMYEARHRPHDHRRKSLAAIELVRERTEKDWRPNVIVLASTHWMPREGFFVDDGALHEDGCDSSYVGVEPQRFSFPGDPELAALAACLGREAGLPVRRIHRVAQEHAVWVPSHLLCGELRIPVVPCSIWWRGPRESHRRWGEALGEAVRRLGRRALFVASGGLSHSFDFSKPPEYVVPTGERFDSIALEWLQRGDHGKLLEMDEKDFEAWNPEGRAGHLYMLRGALGMDLRGELLCYQGSNGTGYLTMVFQN
jgi:aromatic ring-opening dioxygenase catalytic subunit (LigB family)